MEEPVNDEPTDAQLTIVLGQLPADYYGSRSGREVVRLLNQAIFSMRSRGCSEAELAPLVSQAIKELHLGLDEAAYRGVMIQ
jgi:hypothetical protein